MPMDKFGDLRDWGPVMEQLGRLQEQGELGRHRRGLTRILRYRDNWQLREAALKCARNVENPTDELLESALAIMMDENIYHDARVLAAGTLAHLVSKRVVENNASTTVTPEFVLAKMNVLMDSPQTPAFHRAIDSIRQSLN